MKTFAASLLVLGVMGSATAQSPVVEYRFDDVRRKVTLTTSKQALQVERGLRAQSGDKVETGWFSYALIAAERYRARFEIFSSTTVQLAGGTPGIILSLERGRLHAMFDKITGSEPRVVKTPGALLAVRGTQYSVEVDNAGHTTLDVFEGVVEVRSELRKEPLLVHAGEESTYGRHEPPASPRPMPSNREQGGRGGPDGHGGPQPPGREGAPPPPNTPPPAKPPGSHH